MPEKGLEERLVAAARGILRPLVRRLVEHRVPFGALERTLRELYVEVAETEFRLPGRRQTDSRISVLTGINRKEIRRLRGTDPATREPGTFRRNQAADLISRWLADPRTTTRRGQPRVLPYQADKGPSFVALARKVTSDLPPRAILDELTRSGAVELVSGDRVRLVKRGFFPLPDREESLTMLAEDPPELIETMLANVFEAGDTPRLQRKVAYDNIGRDGLARLREGVSREAMRFLEKFDLRFARYDRDRNPKAPDGKRTTAGIGIYWFERPHEDEEESGS